MIQALGDLVESCVGAIFLDSGFDLNLVWKIMLSFLDPVTSLSNVQLNPVRELTEFCQSRKWDLQFPTLKKGRIFSVEANVKGEDVCLAASASNLNKREAIRIASDKIFVKLKVRCAYLWIVYCQLLSSCETSMLTLTLLTWI